MFEANRKDINGPKPRKPFNSRMNKTTFNKYTGVWKQLLSYMWRSEELDEEERPAFKITHEQQVQFDKLINVVDKIMGFDDNAVRQEKEKAEKEIESVVLALCIAMLDHTFEDNQYESVVVSGLAMLGLQEEGIWANAEDYTPILSAIVKLARLMVLLKAHELREWSIKRWKEKKMKEMIQERESQTREERMSENEMERRSQVHAIENAASNVESVQKMMRRFIVLIGNEGKPSPMDWILDTRTYGLHIRYNTAADGTIGWRGDTILY